MRAGRSNRKRPAGKELSIAACTGAGGRPTQASLGGAEGYFGLLPVILFFFHFASAILQYDAVFASGSRNRVTGTRWTSQNRIDKPMARQDGCNLGQTTPFDRGNKAEASTNNQYQQCDMDNAAKAATRWQPTYIVDATEEKASYGPA